MASKSMPPYCPWCGCDRDDHVKPEDIHNGEVNMPKIGQPEITCRDCAQCPEDMREYRVVRR